MKRALAIVALCLTAAYLLAQTMGGPRLKATVLHLTNAVVQPTSGIWNPSTRILEPSADSGQIAVYCGDTVAVYWLSQTGKLYECQAQDVWGMWLGSAMQLAGTGGMVTQYDTPHPHRLYRVKETNR